MLFVLLLMNGQAGKCSVLVSRKPHFKYTTAFPPSGWSCKRVAVKPPLLTAKRNLLLNQSTLILDLQSVLCQFSSTVRAGPFAPCRIVSSGVHNDSGHGHYKWFIVLGEDGERDSVVFNHNASGNWRLKNQLRSCRCRA